MEQDQDLKQEQEQEQKQKKANKSFNIAFAIFVGIVIIIGVIYMLKLVKPEVTINGEKLKVGMKVQDLVDAGFSVGLTMNGGGGLNLDVQPKVPGESYSSKSYYIFAEDEYGRAEYTGVSFSVYNRNTNACDFEDSKIYRFDYMLGSKFEERDVLINGIDFTGMDKEDAIHAFEEKGVKFDKDEKEEFLSGKIGILIGKSGDYYFKLQEDYYINSQIGSVEVEIKV